MNNEKIKELATELAKRLYNDDETYNAILWWGNEPKERKAEELELTLKFLLETHCIIPKVDAINQHAWYMLRMKEVSSNRQMNRGKAIALENLLGKELFNEPEK